MGRRARPRLHQGWYVTEAGGTFTKLARESEGLAVAERRLADLQGYPDADRASAGALSVREAFDVFMTHARTYYRLPSGGPSQELDDYRLSFRELLELAGDLPAAVVDRKVLKAARERMVAAGLSRGVVNQRIGRVKRALKWLASEDHIPARVVESVALLDNLPAHRSAAPETGDVLPVAADVVRATLTKLRDPWRSMVLLAWHTGMRPGEVAGLRLSHLAPAGGRQLVADFSGSHKMAYRGRPRRVAIGPQGCAVLAKWLIAATAHGRDEVFLNPRTERAVLRRSFDEAIRRAAKAANVPHWHPNQLRHSYGTRVRSRFGLDAAQVALGHAKADVTQVYAAAEVERAARVAAEMG